MFEFLFEITKSILQISFVRRLIIVLFLPNVLVWGFNEVGIANKRNFLWNSFVGPYWAAEVFIFKVVFYGFAVGAFLKVVIFFFEWWVHSVQGKEEKQNELARQRKIEEARIEELAKPRPIIPMPLLRPLPEVHAQAKKLELEIQTTSKRITNLVQRVSELPPEVPADAFYGQIKQKSQRLNELKLSKESLKTKEMDLRGQEVDQDGLKAKIENVLKSLDKAPKEKQRPIFTNLVKFIEIHPMKIKIGLYAPVKEPIKATGTDGIPSTRSENSNFRENKEAATVLSFPSTRVGSSTVGNGASGRT
jgi:hypothetical protein